MSNSKSHWRRVARGRVCPICHKPDWCMIAVDDSAAICTRVESTKPAGRAGWVHQLHDDDWPRPAWRPEIETILANLHALGLHCTTADKLQKKEAGE